MRLVAYLLPSVIQTLDSSPTECFLRVVMVHHLVSLDNIFIPRVVHSEPRI